MSTVVAIIFDGGPSGNIYCAGQIVAGHVHVQSAEHIKMRGVRLEVSGKANVSWSEGSGDDRKHYSGNEDYFYLEINLIGSRSKDGELNLQPGVYNYPFSFVLPPELPQSLEADLGYIRYKAKAVIDRPFRIDDTAEVLFTVIRLLDLNREPQALREPMVLQTDSPASGCCCVYGLVEMNLSVNRGCFVPGEMIQIEGEITNRTNTNAKYTSISFIQTIDYCATHGRNGGIGRRTTRTKTLANLQRPLLLRGHTDSLQNVSFMIPPVPPSRLDGCNIINITYYVEVKAVFHDCCSKSSIRHDIVIGNIPLQGTFQVPIITSQPMSIHITNGISDPYPQPYSGLGFDQHQTSNFKPHNVSIAPVHKY